MAKNNLIFVWECKNPVCMAAPRVFVPACLMAGEETCERGCRRNHNNRAGTFHWEWIETFHNLPFYADVTYFSFGSCTQRRPLFLFFFIVFFKRCGKCCKCQNCTFGNLDLKRVDGSHLLVYSNVLHVLIQEQSWTYLLQPLRTLSNSAGADPCTDALFKGVCVV